MRVMNLEGLFVAIGGFIEGLGGWAVEGRRRRRRVFGLLALRRLTDHLRLHMLLDSIRVYSEFESSTSFLS